MPSAVSPWARHRGALLPTAPLRGAQQSDGHLGSASQERRQRAEAVARRRQRAGAAALKSAMRARCAALAVLALIAALCVHAGGQSDDEGLCIPAAHVRTLAGAGVADFRDSGIQNVALWGERRP